MVKESELPDYGKVMKSFLVRQLELPDGLRVPDNNQRNYVLLKLMMEVVSRESKLP